MDLVGIALATTGSAFVEQVGSRSYVEREDGTGEKLRVFRGDRWSVDSFLALWPIGTADSEFSTMILREREVSYTGASAIVTLRFSGYTSSAVIATIPTTYDRVLVPASGEYAMTGTPGAVFQFNYIQPQFSITFPTESAPTGPANSAGSGISGYADSNIEITAIYNVTNSHQEFTAGLVTELQGTAQIQAVGFQAYNDGDIWLVTETWAKVLGGAV
jgi:hypothetical protein